jgi:hypothetical protein
MESKGRVTMNKAAIVGLGVVLAAALECGCLVSVAQVSDPAPDFARARADAAAAARHPGPARELNVLAYDPGDRELVRVSVPMWLARKVAREGRSEAAEGDSAEERASRAVGRHVSLKELERAGPGVLVEVEEEDGEQVLIWLR